MPDPAKPGPRQGQGRNFVAPNNGAQGGRPPNAPTSPTASPMETLPSSLPDFMSPTPQTQTVNTQSQVPTVSPSGQPPPVNPAESQAPSSPDFMSPAPAQRTQATTGSQPAQQVQPAPPSVPVAPPIMQTPKALDSAVPAPDGTRLSTPLGTATITGGIPGSYDLTPQGRQAYAHAKMQRVQKFGRHPWASDPKAPQPPIEPGKPAFNPWGAGDGWSED